LTNDPQTTPPAQTTNTPDAPDHRATIFPEAEAALNGEEAQSEADIFEKESRQRLEQRAVLHKFLMQALWSVAMVWIGVVCIGLGIAVCRPAGAYTILPELISAAVVMLALVGFAVSVSRPVNEKDAELPKINAPADAVVKLIEFVLDKLAEKLNSSGK